MGKEGIVSFGSVQVEINTWFSCLSAIRDLATTRLSPVLSANDILYSNSYPSEVDTKLALIISTGNKLRSATYVTLEVC